MIIKSMARKDPSFGQLMAYFDKAANQNRTQIFTNNLYCNNKDQASVEDQFIDNFRYLPKRKNGNALYHEVIVLEPQPRLSPSDQQSALIALAQKYLEQRASGHLAYGRVHFDRDHPHIHLMISSNAVRSTQRKRLGKNDFNQIQKNLEAHAIEKFPQLEMTPIYNSQKSDHLKQSTREVANEKRQNKRSLKRIHAARFRELLSQSRSAAEFDQCLNSEGFRLYQRGNITGIEPIGEGRRYRLRTLGLETSFKALGQEKQIQTSHKPPQKDEDPRAAMLLSQRSQLTKEAEQQLDDFERGA